MSACTYLEAFDIATEHLTDRLYEQAQYRSIWLNLIKRGTLQQGVGTSFVVYGTAIMEPTTDTGVWESIDLSSRAGSQTLEDVPNLCTNNWQDVEPGFVEETYGPEMKQLRGPEVCEKHLMFVHNMAQFLNSYQAKLKIRLQREWELNYAYHHRRLSRKVVTISDFENAFYDQEALTGLECPSCELTQEMLDYIAERMIDDGATNPDSNGFITYEDAGPLWTLYIGSYQSKRIKTQNAELRKDIRYADPNSLLARLGATTALGNFRHVINDKPRRYTCSNGTFTIVPYYADDTAVTNGDGQKTNPDWRTAPYEGADILSPDLFTSELAEPPGGAGGFAFDPKTYSGQWQLKIGAWHWAGDGCTGTDAARTGDDPLGQRARHFAELIHAPAHNPLAKYKYGYHIIFKRCQGNLMECTTCSS